MAVPPDDIQRLFLKIAELPPEERESALEQECSGRPEVLQRVAALLAAHDDPDSFLDGSDPPFEATIDSQPSATADHSPVSEAGLVIAGRYTLVDKIGEGGMGEVWVAKQTEPVKRRVALKLIKTGMDSQAVLRRFEQERQALAMMDHPNIARVLDGGLTPTGQPFFVMELVSGLAFTKFCDETTLTPKERLELFLPICRAVQHAHQKGIVHRDLKPANILVTIIDGEPVPKVIDFGVSKAISGKLMEDTLTTQFGAVVGTLEYMAPEQAGYSGTDIDTRADIYSLGVILYEILTGLRPIDAKKLGMGAIGEMIRIIREEEPSKPSTRLSTDDSLPSLAAVRQTEPKKLMALLRGELDWVVMKCLEKNRDRRYETANGLARDIERHLNNEPVEARAPSAAYRLHKFARRNRAAIVTVALVAISLVFGFGISLWQAIRATRAEALANQRYETEQEARETAQAARKGERQQRLVATNAQRLAEQREYDANLLVVQKHWEQNNLSGFKSLLESLEPKEGHKDLRGFEWYYWANKARRGFVEVGEHSGQVASVAFSPDGSQFASGAGTSRGQGQVLIWSTATRQIVRELSSHRYRVHKVTFSPNGQFLATASGEHSKGGQVKVWNLATGEEVFHRDFKNSVNSVAFHPDGSKLVAGSTVLFGEWGALKVWDWQRGEELFSEEHENKGYRGATFTPDGKRIAAGSRENGVAGSQIEIWDLATKEVEILPAHADFVFSIAFRQQDERLAAAVGTWNGPPGLVRQWDKTGRELPVQLIGHEGRVWSVCFNQDGSRIATGCYDNSIKIWDAESGAELTTLRGHTSHALSVTFSPDDKYLVSGSGDTSVRLWDAQQGQGSLTTKKQPDALHSVTFSRNGKRIASGGHDGNAKIWDARTGLEIMCLSMPEDKEGRSVDVFRVAFSPDDDFLATASGIGTSFGFGDLPPVPGDIRVWDLATQQVVHHFTGHTAKGCCVAFSPDGQSLASASGGWGEPGEIKVWSLATGQELELGLEGESGIIWPVAFSPNGKFLAWARLDYPADVNDRVSANEALKNGRTESVVIIWDLDKAEAALQLVGHKAGVLDIAFHPNGTQLATGSADKTIKIWDLETGMPIHTMSGHSERVHSVAYSPDGDRLVSCGNDATAKLWDLETGRELLTFQEHGNFVWAVAFSPDGEHIASSSGDCTIKIWDGTRDTSSEGL